jgi:ABC-type polar amino acid transport system ATPase subunit
MFDRAKRTLIRNLRALRELQEGSLVIHADQVNIARQQVNQQAVR